MSTQAGLVTTLGSDLSVGDFFIHEECIFRVDSIVGSELFLTCITMENTSQKPTTDEYEKITSSVWINACQDCATEKGL